MELGAAIKLKEIVLEFEKESTIFLQILPKPSKK